MPVEALSWRVRSESAELRVKVVAAYGNESRELEYATIYSNKGTAHFPSYTDG